MRALEILGKQRTGAAGYTAAGEGAGMSFTGMAVETGMPRATARQVPGGGYPEAAGTSNLTF